MRAVHLAYAALYVTLALLFAACGLALIALACLELAPAVNPFGDAALDERFMDILRAIGVATIAVAAIELSQTVLEEEVRRTSHLSSPTRARRFVSRFLVVIIVSSGIEFLIGIFEFLHRDPQRLPHVAAVGVACAVLLVAWGVFVRLNHAAELLEPEALASVKREDADVEPDRNGG